MCQNWFIVEAKGHCEPDRNGSQFPRLDLINADAYTQRNGVRGVWQGERESAGWEGARSIGRVRSSCQFWGKLSVQRARGEDSVYCAVVSAM